MSTVPDDRLTDRTGELLQTGLSPADVQVRLIEEGMTPEVAAETLNARIPDYLRNEVSRMTNEGMTIMRTQDALIDRGFERGIVFAVVDGILARPMTGTGGASAPTIAASTQNYTPPNQIWIYVFGGLFLVGAGLTAVSASGLLRFDAFIPVVMAVMGYLGLRWVIREPPRDPVRDKLLEQLSAPIPGKTAELGVRDLKENLANLNRRPSGNNPS